MGEQEVFCCFDNKEQADSMLVKLENKSVWNYDEFWIETFTTNKGISLKDIKQSGNIGGDEYE